MYLKNYPCSCNPYSLPKFKRLLIQRFINLSLFSLMYFTWKLIQIQNKVLCNIHSAVVLIIASVKHGISQCSLLCIISSVILQSAVYLGHRNQTKQFAFINDSKIFYPKLLSKYLLMTALVSSPCIKWNPPPPTGKNKSQTVCIYSSEKMVFSRTLHKPTTTNKMGEAEKQIYHRLRINVRIFSSQPAPPYLCKYPNQLEWNQFYKGILRSPTTEYILKLYYKIYYKITTYQISGKTSIWKERKSNRHTNIKPPPISASVFFFLK